MSSLQPHIEQQLVRDGNISGTTAQSRSEADRRVSELLSREEVRSIDWHDAVESLEDLHSEGKISQNTWLQLTDAAMRSRSGTSHPAPDLPEAEWTGPDGYEDWDGI